MKSNHFKIEYHPRLFLLSIAIVLCAAIFVYCKRAYTSAMADATHAAEMNVSVLSQYVDGKISRAVSNLEYLAESFEKELDVTSEPDEIQQWFQSKNALIPQNDEGLHQYGFVGNEFYASGDWTLPFRLSPSHQPWYLSAKAQKEDSQIVLSTGNIDVNNHASQITASKWIPKTESVLAVDVMNVASFWADNDLKFTECVGVVLNNAMEIVSYVGADDKRGRAMLGVEGSKITVPDEFYAKLISDESRFYEDLKDGTGCHVFVRTHACGWRTIAVVNVADIQAMVWLPLIRSSVASLLLFFIAILLVYSRKQRQSISMEIRLHHNAAALEKAMMALQSDEVFANISTLLREVLTEMKAEVAFIAHYEAATEIFSIDRGDILSQDRSIDARGYRTKRRALKSTIEKMGQQSVAVFSAEEMIGIVDEYGLSQTHSTRQCEALAVGIVQVNGKLWGLVNVAFRELVMCDDIALDFLKRVTMILCAVIERQQMHLKLAEAKDNIIDALSGDFSLVSSFNVENYDETILRVDDSTKALMPGLATARSHKEREALILNTAIHPDDREAFIKGTRLETIMAGLEKASAYYVNFRNVGHGAPEYWQAKFVKTGTEPVILIAGYHSVDAETRAKLKEEETLRQSLQTISEQNAKLGEQQKALEDALQMANSASRAKTTFLNNMSHDIRTPMNAIIGFTTLAISHPDDKEKIQDYLRKIDQSSNHLLSLINDVLDMSRIESGKMTLEEQNENLIDIVNALKNIVIADVQSKQLELTVDYSNVRNPNVICDKLRMNQVLLNILSNAIKYTPAGGKIALTVLEKAAPQGRGAYEIRVKDNGMGMSKEFLKTIFEQFTRVKSSTVSGIQGTGLGMAITKSIVTMMKGTIDIESEEKVGTEVILNFEFALAAVAAKVVAAENPEEVFDFTGKKILLTEDNELNREIGQELLSENGFEVDTAEDGSIAVDMVKQKGIEYYDFILMDIQMPVMDGYEATKALRKLPNGDKLKIIALSANAFEEDKMKSLSVGMNDHVAKPLKVHVLLEALKKLA